MPLVDLRGREHEASHLLEPRPGWTLVGWAEGDTLVGCAAVERDGRDLHVRALGGAAREELLDELARVVSADRLHTPDGVVELRGEPVPSHALTLAQLEDAIRGAWSVETSDSPEEWTPELPSRGQCGATAAVVRDWLGGEILIANVLLDGRRAGRHAWNRLPSGLAVDLTRCQFTDGEELEAPRVEEPVTMRRDSYELLARRVREALA
jgi:hypothetical protein